MPHTTARTLNIVHRVREVRRALGDRLQSMGYCVRAFASAEAFLSEGLPDRPDCVLLDSDLPDVNGQSLQQIVQHPTINVPVVFVAIDPQVTTAVRAMKDGAIDFLCMPVGADELATAVARAVQVADVWRDGEVRRSRARMLVARLTPRERAVFTLLLEGKLNKQIAGALESREATVKVHRSRLVRKLEVRSLAELLDLGRQLDRDALASDCPARSAPVPSRDAALPRSLRDGPRARVGEAAAVDRVV
jgi:FixJ family two-component response regulator